MKIGDIVFGKRLNLLNKVNCINILQYFHFKKVLFSSALAS